MRTVVVYESMYGNTHTVAEGIALGLRDLGEVVVVPVHRATPELLDKVDLVVVGGPTHVHGLSSEATRNNAVAEAVNHSLTLDEDAPGPGLRDWLADLTLPGHVGAAAFDTRLDGPAIVTGRASRGIVHRLHKVGVTVISDPESFLVTKQSTLVDGEVEHARRWGTELAAYMNARHDRVHGHQTEEARLRTVDAARDHLSGDLTQHANFVAHRTASSWR